MEHLLKEKLIKRRQRMIQRSLKNNYQEALNWFEKHKSTSTFASWRFDTPESALDFTKKLYEFGAKEVRITDFFETGEANDLQSNTMIVFLPEDKQKRENLLNLYKQEMKKSGLYLESELNEIKDNGQDFLYLSYYKLNI